MTSLGSTYLVISMQISARKPEPCARPCVRALVAPRVPTSLNMSRLENDRMQDTKKNEYVNQHVVDEHFYLFLR